jgi:hypothetical protein
VSTDRIGAVAEIRPVPDEQRAEGPARRGSETLVRMRSERSRGSASKRSGEQVPDNPLSYGGVWGISPRAKGREGCANVSTFVDTSVDADVGTPVDTTQVLGVCSVVSAAQAIMRQNLTFAGVDSIAIANGHQAQPCLFA